MKSTVKNSKFYLLIKKNIFLLIENLSLLINKIIAKNAKCARVITYHRIANIKDDPTMLSVSSENFKQHVSFLNEHFKIIEARELVRRIKTQSIVGNEVVITFDDGYRDNLEAFYELRNYDVPAIIFISTSQLGKLSDHSWDKFYSESERAYFLNEEEILNIKHELNVDIGGHTENHLSLKQLDEQKQSNEILINKKKLEDIINEKIYFFSYPFGNFNNVSKKTVGIVKKYYEAAFMNNNLLVTNSTNIYKIPRINIRNYSLDKFKKKIYYE